jgi:endonuclease YncB( thermonuclease family)
VGQPFAATAKQFIGDLVFSKAVNVRVLDGDCYHRLVAEITLPDGKILRYARSDTELEPLETDVKAAKRGLLGRSESGAAVGNGARRKLPPTA